MLSPSDAEMRKEMGFLKKSMVEMLERFGVMEQTLNDIDQRTGEMALIQGIIQEDVRDIKKIFAMVLEFHQVNVTPAE